MFLFLLAEGVAPITSATGAGGVWDQWLTPQGVGAALGLLTSFLTVVALILNILGKKDLAQKVTDANETVQDKSAQLQAAVETLRGVIGGIEEAKKGLSPDAKLHLVTTIQNVATKMGGQATLDPIVQAVKNGNADSATIMKTLNEALAKLQAAS